MTRKFKTLGLALAAVFAMGAFGASAASAAEFHSASAPVNLSGTQTESHVFETTSGTMTCKGMTFSGSSNVTTPATITMIPSEQTSPGCTIFGFLNVPIHFNGCAYIFSPNSTTIVECQAGKEIEFTVPGCTWKVPAQHLNAGGNTFTSNGVDIVVTTNISDIEYTECDGKTYTGGKYIGKTTVTGSSPVSGAAIKVSYT